MNHSSSSAAHYLGSRQNVRKLHNVRITISVDCEDILKPDVHNPTKHTFLSGSESVQKLQLSQLIGITTLSQVKIKMIHTCGLLKLDGEPCLEALWNIGQALVDLFDASGRQAKLEKWTNENSKNWLDVDAKVMVYLD
ncbi:hypothetical protein ST47_g7578 [Ascochyta rabiei]|uniref:Uncharacterized protein n=1 Tax=Didymella rabiei TaxID=5454 RepID=A0A163AMY7_DIDRA|nr:hypothetical protein ST47_g7578 [Ascochyta rabiei]